MPNITVHHLNNSKSQRILWVLEELGLPYDIKYYQRQPTMAAPPEMREVHPLGKSPITEIDGKVMAESGAVVGFLIDRFGGGRFAPAKDGDDWGHYIEMLHYPEGSANTPFFLNLIVNAMQLGDSPLKQYADEQTKLHLDYMQGLLGDDDYLVGNEFSGADIQIGFTLQGANVGGLLEGRQNLIDYVAKLEARPAYKAAIEKGGDMNLDFGG